MAAAAAARVPTLAQVRPGAAVSIVLKQDQATARQVQGVIADVLTRGNHPRGIKVRLRDGRIGRVQRMVVVGNGADADANADAAVATLLPDAATLQKDLREQAVARGERKRGGGGGGGGDNSKYRSERLGLRYTYVRREEEEEGKPTEELDLMSYVKQPKTRKGKGKGKGGGKGDGKVTEAFEDGEEPAGVRQSAGAGETLEKKDLLTCPVCGDFEGDEAAVAHHVNSHFD